MKKIILVIIGLGVILGGIAYKMVKVETITVDKIRTEVVEKVVEKEVPTLDKRIADAISASSTDIETKAQQAYEDAKKNAENEIALRITTEYRKEIEAMEVELEKEVGTY